MEKIYIVGDVFKKNELYYFDIMFITKNLKIAKNYAKNCGFRIRNEKNRNGIEIREYETDVKTYYNYNTIEIE